MPGPDPYDAYRQSDAADRRLAARLAADQDDQFTGWQERADAVYGWLRARPTVAPARLELAPGVPVNQQEAPPVSIELDMVDNQEDTITVQAKDAMGAPVPDGPFTWSESSGGAVVTLEPSADGNSCTVRGVAPGTATLTATDPNGISGTEAVVVSPGPVASFDLVPGTPTEQPPAGP